MLPLRTLQTILFARNGNSSFLVSSHRKKDFESFGRCPWLVSLTPLPWCPSGFLCGKHDDPRLYLIWHLPIDRRQRVEKYRMHSLQMEIIGLPNGNYWTFIRCRLLKNKSSWFWHFANTRLTCSCIITKWITLHSVKFEQKDWIMQKRGDYVDIKIADVAEDTNKQKQNSGLRLSLATLPSPNAFIFLELSKSDVIIYCVSL